MSNTLSIVGTNMKTTSLKIAEVYGKRHDNVLRSIDNLVSDLGGKSDEFCVLNFEEDENIEVFQNKTETRRYYNLTEEAALMLTGRMSGKESALRMKEVAKAFTAMKRALHAHRLIAEGDAVKALEDAREQVNVYKTILDDKANTLAKLMGVAPAKSRPLFERLEELGLVTATPKEIHGWTYAPTQAGMQYVDHLDYNRTIHWLPAIKSVFVKD